MNTTLLSCAARLTVDGGPERTAALSALRGQGLPEADCVRRLAAVERCHERRFDSRCATARGGYVKRRFTDTFYQGRAEGAVLGVVMNKNACSKLNKTNRKTEP
jgi:hypothetical protein